MSNASITVRLAAKCQRSYQCGGCGSRYTYATEEAESASGRSVEEATMLAQNRCRRAFEEATGRRACPVCGAVAPDILFSLRDRRFIHCVLASALLLPIPLYMYFEKKFNDFGAAAVWLSTMTLGGMTILNVATWLCVLVAAVLWWRLWRASHRTLGRTHRRNRDEAELGVAGVRVSIESRGDFSSDHSGSASSVWEGRGRLVLLAGCGVVFLATPELLRLGCGWNLNAPCVPEVVGPGDTVQVNLPETIPAVDKRWNGKATARIRNADTLHLRRHTLVATTRTNKWGDTLSERSSLERSLWVKVIVPGDVEFARKDLALNIHGQLVYPARRDSDTFDNRRHEFSHNVRLRTASRGAGFWYGNIWLGGQIGGVLLIFAASLLLFSQNRSRGRPKIPTVIMALH